MNNNEPSTSDCLFWIDCVGANKTDPTKNDPSPAQNLQGKSSGHVDYEDHLRRASSWNDPCAANPLIRRDIQHVYAKIYDMQSASGS